MNRLPIVLDRELKTDMEDQSSSNTWCWKTKNLTCFHVYACMAKICKDHKRSLHLNLPEIPTTLLLPSDFTPLYNISSFNCKNDCRIWAVPSTDTPITTPACAILIPCSWNTYVIAHAHQGQLDWNQPNGPQPQTRVVGETRGKSIRLLPRMHFTQRAQKLSAVSTKWTRIDKNTRIDWKTRVRNKSISFWQGTSPTSPTTKLSLASLAQQIASPQGVLARCRLFTNAQISTKATPANTALVLFRMVLCLANFTDG